MYLCYIDESGTSDLPGTSSHFVLAGFSIPIAQWRNSDRDISLVLSKYGLEAEELHTAWLVRKYLEQTKIPDFEKLDWASRRSAVERYRISELLRLRKLSDPKPHRQAKKNYSKTKNYIHLTHAERLCAVQDVADLISSWGNARLFAECIDKTHHDPVVAKRSVGEQSFEQVVSRFQRYLTNMSASGKSYGLLIHDNNESVAKKHTEMMRQFHQGGTLWTSIDNLIETPLFVDSSLTRMVQIADLCAFALRRYAENGEADLFRRIFARADRSGVKTVGVRHYAGRSCKCEICASH